MKILELRLKNLNSLYGEWHIDFTHPDYLNNGIFAITGPTGAGKSTILDAICLALYGATPRLGKITKSSNEIMSRHCGECYAELVFESNTGCFRCQWQQRRARKSPKGKLQDQEHQISEYENGKLLESKRSLVLAVIEEKTGMDFERFTRSILLAQGGFDNFLKADSEQKSKILEQITGTEIYSNISRHVHQRLRDEKEQLARLELETSGITLLSPEQQQALTEELKQKSHGEQVLVKQLNETQQAIAWLEKMDSLQKDITNLNQENAELIAKYQAFKPQQQRLDQAVKAATLEGEYATLNAMRQQQSLEQKSLGTLQLQLPDLQSSLLEQKSELNKAEKQCTDSKFALKAALPLLQQVRSLDRDIKRQQESIVDRKQHCYADEKKIEQEETHLEKLRKQIEATEQNLKQAKNYLGANANDEELSSEIPAIEQQISSLLIQQRELDQEIKARIKIEQALKTVQSSLTESETQETQASSKLEQIKQNIQNAENSLLQVLQNKLLREYRSEKDSLLREMLLHRKIEELQGHRDKLEDGKPCPLCGALQHPYAEGNTPELGILEKRIAALELTIKKAEQEEDKLRALQQLESEAIYKLQQSKQQALILASKKQSEESRLEELCTRIDKLTEEVDQIHYLVSIKLEPFGIRVTSIHQLEDTIKHLKERMHKWKQVVDDKNECEREIAKANHDLTRQKTLIESQRNTLQEKLNQLQIIVDEQSKNRQHRVNLFSNKIPEKEEQKLYDAINHSEQEEKMLRALHQQKTQELTSIKSKLESIQNTIQQRAPILEETLAVFVNLIEKAGFETEESFKHARLNSEEYKQLEAQSKSLNNRKAEIDTKMRDRKEQLQQESDKQLSEDDLPAAKTQHTQQQTRLNELREQIARLKHQITQNQKAEEQVLNKQREIKAQNKECQRWDRLHQLIGSADGKKYRNFAQGLTFELLINHANQQLQKMSSRYLLIHHQSQTLELNIIDNYQAGEARSTRNLSGGESFIISLSLALGLSNMSSRKVRVDSLFLDEGFGALDEEALDTALEVLASLHQEGKLIGVISHINQLKERIATQIRVEPISNGKSQIIGAGCVN